MKALSTLFICVLGLSLSACESGNWITGSNDADVRYTNRTVNAPAEPMAKDVEIVTNDEVIVASTEESFLDQPVIPMTPPAPLPMIKAQGMTMGDPSVTIYPLPGEPLLGVAPMPTGSLMPQGMGSYAMGGVAASDAVIYFKHGSSRLGSGDMQKLSAAADAARFSPVNRVRVEGHASRRAQTSDPVKSSILNLKESMNRAFAVSKTLIQKGVPAEKIKTTAYGDTVPASSEREQRRVDVITGAGMNGY